MAPDGSATLIHRLVAGVRVPAAQVSAPVDIKLAGFAHQFAKGHAVRLTLASTDASYRNATVPDQITVTTGAGSTFTLPGGVARAVAQPLPAPKPAGGPLPATGASTLPGLVGLALVTSALVLRRRRTR